MGINFAIATTPLPNSGDGLVWKDFLKQYSQIASKKIRIILDSDDSGNVYARTVAAVIIKAMPEANVKLVELPYLPGGWNCEFWPEHRKEETEDEGTYRKELATLVIQRFRKLCKDAKPVTSEDIAEWERNGLVKTESASKTDKSAFSLWKDTPIT